jgi:hypothetical protein
MLLATKISSAQAGKGKAIITMTATTKPAKAKSVKRDWVAEATGEAEGMGFGPPRRAAAGAKGHLAA